MDRRTLTVSRPEMAEDSLGFFRWGRIAGQVLITTDAGDSAFLSEAEFSDLLAGRIADGHPRFQELQRKGALREGWDLDAFVARVAQRNRHVRRGPHLHVVTLTSRRAQPGADGPSTETADADMSAETAEKIVEFAMESPSPVLTFEFQGGGGEPLLNFDVLRHMVEFAQTRNKRSDGKTLNWRLLSNFSAMSEDAAAWLTNNDVQIFTTFDGPASVHDWNRQWTGGTPHADVVRWMDDLGRRYAERGTESDWGVQALLTTTRRTLEAWREVIDAYAARGLRTIHLRPLDAFRFDPRTWDAIGYGVAEYLDVYRRALDYIIELNRQGVELVERTAAIFLTKILTSDDPGIVDLQSPSGAGSGEIAYDVDGRVFPSDEARAVDALGEPMFELGQVRELTLPEVVRHPTVRAIAAASLLDAQPMCVDCWNKPFCGFSPVRNVATQGDLFGQRPRCSECKEHKAVAARLFELLGDSDASRADILRSWTAKRSRFSIDGRAATPAP